MLEYMLGKKARAYIGRPHSKRVEIVITGEEDFPHLYDKRVMEILKLLNEALRQT